jgi:hypothetical protein
MDEAENVDPKYVQGFNQGYYLARHMPDLADKLTSIKGESLHIEGLKHGIEQYNLEQAKDRTPDWLKADRIDTLDRSQKQKDKDKDGPDRE